MWDMNEVESIKYSHDYVYSVVFDDGLSAEIDFEPYLVRGPIFEPLKACTKGWRARTTVRRRIGRRRRCGLTAET